jgi:hypothetical protein
MSVNVRLNIHIDAMDGVIERVRSIDAAAKAAQNPAAEAMATATQQRIEERVRAPKSGIQWPGQPRPSGISGGYPANQWGDLLASIWISQTRHGNATLLVGAGLPDPYAMFLEMGFTTPSGRFVKFPFVRPSVESLSGEYTTIVQEVVAQHI